MPVDDLWYLRKREGGKLVPSKRHGRGKRWRVRWVDPETGRKRERLFDKKADAEQFDATMRADISRGQYIDPRTGRVTVAEWAEQWRSLLLHRESTAERTDRVLRLHVLPVLGHLHLSAVRRSHVQGWVKDRERDLAPSTLRMIYHGTLMPMFAAAVADRVIASSPCVDVRLPEVGRSDRVIPTVEQVQALYDALPERYRAIVYLAAGCGLRGGEILGMEVDGVDFLRREVHVRQQLKAVQGRPPFLAPPKTKTSTRAVELPEVVADVLARHIERHPPELVDVDDETDPRRPARRGARLLFTTRAGAPIHRSTWSHIWRHARGKTDVPEDVGLHALRHYYATVLIHGGANVKTVQLAMGHTTASVTLDTYTHLWPDAVDRTRSLVDSALAGTTSAQSTSISADTQ